MCWRRVRLHAFRQAQLLEGRHVLRNDAERERDRAALAERVDAEAREILALVRDIEITGLLELADLERGRRANRLEHRLQGEIVERRFALHRGERAVAPKDRRLADLEMDVARAEFDGTPEQGIQVHRSGPSLHRQRRNQPLVPKDPPQPLRPSRCWYGFIAGSASRRALIRARAL